MKRIYGNDIFVTQVKFSYSSITKLNRLNIGATISNYSRKFKIFIFKGDSNIDMGKRYCTDGVKTIKLNDNDEIPEGFSLGRTFKANPWNKGLTKETSKKVADIAVRMRNTRATDNSFKSWNKGLTKEINESLATVSRKVSKYRQGKSSWNKGLARTETEKKLQSEKMKGCTPWNKGLTKETDSRVTKISDKLMGHKSFVVDWELAKRKEYSTKKLRNSFNVSKDEESYYKYLLTKYDSDDIIRQYSDERYSFNCDFYIKSEDLFIELNYHWTHGSHMFDDNSEHDLEILQTIREKQKLDKNGKKNMYFYYEYIWTIRDVLKYKTLLENNLNFMIIYPKGIIYTNCR